MSGANLALLVTLLALAVAVGCGLLLLLVLAGPHGPVDTVQLHRDLEAQLLFAGARPRPGLRERPYARTRSRLNRAGLDSISTSTCRHSWQPTRAYRRLGMA